MRKQSKNLAKSETLVIPDPEKIRQAILEYVQKDSKRKRGGLITTELTSQEKGWLEGSILSPFNNYENGSVEDFATDIFYNLAKGHNLINGNKRWALVALLYFLDINNYELKASNKDVLKLARKVVKSNRKKNAGNQGIY
jgi:death-on-curing family protein